MIKVRVMRPDAGDVPSELSPPRVADLLIEKAFRDAQFGFAKWSDGSVMDAGQIKGLTREDLDAQVAEKDGQTLKLIPTVGGG